MWAGKVEMSSHAGGQAGRYPLGKRNSTGKFANYGCQLNDNWVGVV